MAKGRDYAEKLVGPLDRSFYSKQSDVAEKTIQTNWDDIQNQYKNLQEKLKREQEIANRDFAEGLVKVSEGSNDRMSAATDNLARSGLTASGVKDIIRQNDITTKGEEVLDLLEKSGDVNVTLAENLSEANKTVTDKQNELSGKLADVLGDIGAADTSAQMAYNKGLADIGEAMEAREAKNALEKAKREAEAAARSYNTKEQDDELEEFYKRKAIVSILNGINPKDGKALDIDDTKKAMILSVMYDINNANDVVSAYNTNAKATETYNTNYNNALKDKQKNDSADTFETIKQNVIKESTNGDLFLDSILSETNSNGTKVYSSEDSVMKESKDKDTLFKYLRGDESVSEKDAQEALKNLTKTTKGDNGTKFSTIGSMSAPSNYNRHQYGSVNEFGNIEGGQKMVTLGDLKDAYARYGGNQDNLIDFKANIRFQEGTVDTNKAFNDIRKNGITYEDLAALLYGNR